MDQWNSDRLDRVEEAEIIGRFLVDLQSDLDDISVGLEIISRKEAALLRVSSSLEAPVNRPADISGFLEDIVTGSSYGWDQHHARRLTVDEVLASGKFSLIRDTTVRLRISDYYETAISRETRIDGKRDWLLTVLLQAGAAALRWGCRDARPPRISAIEASRSGVLIAGARPGSG